MPALLPPSTGPVLAAARPRRAKPRAARTIALALLVGAAGAASADPPPPIADPAAAPPAVEAPAAPSVASPTAGDGHLIDPLGRKARFDLLGPLRADAAGAKVPPVSAVIPPGGECKSDNDCAGRAYCGDGGRCVELTRRTWALFYFHQGGPRGYRHVFPLYWNWWSEKREGRIVAPFYWDYQNRVAGTRDTFVLPLYQYRRTLDKVAHRLWPLFFYERYGQDGKDGSSVGLIPFFWASRQKTRQTGAAPLLLSGWSRDTASGDYRAMVLGLSWFSRDGDNKKAIIFPLFFHTQTKERTRTVVFPLVWHFTRPAGSTTVVLPLGVFGTDRERGLTHATLVPFFHYRSEERGQRRLFVTPLGFYERDQIEDSRQILSLALPFYWRQDKKRDVHVTPLSVHWRQHAEQRTVTVVGPFFQSKDPAGATRGLFPLFWHFEDRASGAQTGLLLPLLAWHRSPTTRAGVVGPSYFYRGPAGWAGGLFPLFHVQNLEGRERQYLLPVFYHQRNLHTGRELLAIGPFFGQKTRDGWDGGLLPLLFFGRHGENRYFVLGPVVHKSGPAGATTVLPPIYAAWGAKGEGRYAVGVAPLFHFGGSKEGHLRWLLPPLYLHWDDRQSDSQFTMIGPLFRSREGRDLTQGVFPLAWNVIRGPRRYDVVLPLFARVRDDERKTTTLWIGPYLGRRDERRESSTHVFFPLFAKHDEPGYHVVVQFPLFWRVVDGDRSSTVVFPLYGRFRRPGFALDTLFPVVWHVRRGDATTTVAGPFFYHRGPERSEGGLLPLFGWGRRGSEVHAWGLPLFYHSHDHQKGTSRTLLASFYWDRRTDGWTSVLAPLWFGWRRQEMTRLFTPISYHQRNSEAGSRLDVIGPFYDGSTPHSHITGLAPFVFTKTWEDGRWSATVLPLFHAARKADGGLRVITPLFGWTTYPTGEKGYVGPLYFRKEEAGYSAALFPIFYHAHDRVADTTTTIIPPLFLRRATPERTLLAVTPLFWRQSSIESATTVLFPLFFDHHAYSESRSTGVLPFYLRHHNRAEQETTHVIPPLLLYVKRAQEGTDVVFFPLVYRFVGKGGNRSTVVFPLFWDIRRGSSVTQVLFPLYVRALRDNADHLVVLNVYYKRIREEKTGRYTGGYHFHFLPLFDFGRPRPQDLEWNVLGGLFGYSRIGRNRTLRLLFGVEVPLDPAITAAAPAGSFFTTSPSSRQDLY